MSEPGWDGIVSVAVGNAWVPDGHSYWEISTSKDPAKKASSDFQKRISALSAEQAAQATFVFVTSRRWRGKAAWQTRARNQNVWADVLVWDADDLEAWLETSSTTSLWMASQVGIAGPGITTVEAYWDHWHQQSNPILTSAALLTGRELARDELLQRISQLEGLIAVMADSQSEAVGFACAQLVESGDSLRTVCVTSEEGWQFVDTNPGIELVVVANNQLVSHRAPRKGMSLIIPLAVGDMAFNLMGAAENAADQNVVELRRPRPDEFEKALLELGVAPSDAARYTGTLGRSWTVFRRLFAANPAVRKPAWMDATDATNVTALHVLTLVGAWDGDSQGDRACVEQIANRSYEEIEAALLELASRDDAPVLKIGHLWKAKAPLELLSLVGPRLPGAILSRFFQVAMAVFEEPDPVLDLEDNKRLMALIYGKVREHSGIVLDAMADSIAKLGYFSEEYPNAEVVGREVRKFIQKLLANASEDRWLSISQHLRSFAEAAPEEYLSAIKENLSSSQKTVLQLITETQHSSGYGRCWHAGLLWSLEMLAWNPGRLNTVAGILATLSNTAVKGNWSNTPFNSLVSLFRPWWPQTAALVDLRISVVGNVVKQHPHAGWRLLLELASNNHRLASPNAKPRWRDDDTGAGDGVTDGEYSHFVLAMASLLVGLARGNAGRIAELIPMANRLDTEFRDTVIGLVNDSVKFQDEDKELIRAAVRKFISWENSFNPNGENHDRRFLADSLRPAFDLLAADDLVIRHAWVFSYGSIELPDGQVDDYEETDRARAALRSIAVQQIFNAKGWQGIDQLVDRCGDSWHVGWELVSDSFDRKELVGWLCKRYLELAEFSFDSLVEGVLHAVPKAECNAVLLSLMSELERNGASSIAIAGLMSNAPQAMHVWSLIESQEVEVRDHFWKLVQPSHVHTDNDDLAFCIEKLLAAERPRTALAALGNRGGDVPSGLLVQLLMDLGAGHEPDAPPPRVWNISHLFSTLAKAGHLSQSELAKLEFSYYKILHREEIGIPNLLAEILSSPQFFMDLICLADKPQHSAPELMPENMQNAATTASSLIHNGRGVPGRDSDGLIDPEVFSEWICSVRKLAHEQDRSVDTDETIGAWLSDWPHKNNLDSWPAPVIADLLDQDDCEDIRRGFITGVYNSRGVSSRMPYDGGDQEREIANKFRTFGAAWEGQKPNLAVMIENLAKSFEVDSLRFDYDARWKQES
ncbi:MAG: hypothetical protein OXC84_07845 [Gammaproteobacteria bacterium]|nr:hypothetical protein [Gammaproteobacteria bacterium]